MPPQANRSTVNEDAQRRELLVLQAGPHLLGVFTEDVAGIANGKSPAPLPRAPASVLGVIAFRGRMLTVIDPLQLLGDAAGTMETGIIVALSGEEQLAITVDSSRGAIQVSPAEVEIADPDRASEIFWGKLQRDGDRIDIIDVSRLFRATMQQQERRRRRF